MKKQPNRWLTFSSLAFQIGAIMYGAVWLGQYLDTFYVNQKSLFYKFGIICFWFGHVIICLIYQTNQTPLMHYYVKKDSLHRPLFSFNDFEAFYS